MVPLCYRIKYLISFIAISFYCLSGNKSFSQFSLKEKYIGLAANMNIGIGEREPYYYPLSSSKRWRQYYNFNVTPDFSYILNNKLAIGSKLNYSYESYNDYGRQINTELAFTPYLRVFKIISPNIILFSDLQLSAGYGLIKDRFISNITMEKFSSKWNAEQYFASCGISPGILLFLSKKISLQFDIGNLSYTYAAKKTYPNTDFLQNDSFLFSYNDIWFGLKFFFVLKNNSSQNTEEEKKN